MRLVDATEPTFARHETFHPRYGWFRKAYSFAAWNPHIFTRDDAPVLIGVGKNMVRSIRFWGLAAKLIIEDPQSPNRRAPGLVPTRLGHALFGETGWDPYMEDPGTLWLLHWMLLAPPSRLPVWWLAFNEFPAVEFDDGELEMAVTAQLEAAAEWASPHPSSVKKDISALLRTYAPAERSGRTSIDDILNCPLRELNLIGRSPATGSYRFTLGAKPTLPAEIVAYAVLDYVTRTGTGGNTITLSRLAHEPGGPGRAFKLAEAELLAVLEPTIDAKRELGLAAPTGATQLSWTASPARIAVDILNDYYTSIAMDVRAGPDGDQPIDDDLLESLGLGRDTSDTMRRLHAAAGPPVGRSHDDAG